MSLTALFGFLGAFFSLASALFGEYLKRSSAAAQAQKAYILSQDEFNSIVDSVATRNRLQAAKDSQAAQTVETQVDQSVEDRKNSP